MNQGDIPRDRGGWGRISIATKAGPHVVRAQIIGPFGVHAQHAQRGSTTNWTLTHIRTGLAIMHYQRFQAAANTAAALRHSFEAAGIDLDTPDFEVVVERFNENPEAGRILSKSNGYLKLFGTNVDDKNYAEFRERT